VTPDPAVTERLWREAGGGTPDYDVDRHVALMLEAGWWTPPVYATSEPRPTDAEWTAFLDFIGEAP
jgi:hypothetical protein